MNTTPEKFDVDAIDIFVRKAHKERSDAMTGAFVGLAEMVI